MRIDGRFVAVTLASVVSQRVVRHKTEQKDKYTALVLEVQGHAKKPHLHEIRVDSAALETYPVGATLAPTLLEGVDTVRLSATSKGKGFQ